MRRHPFTALLLASVSLGACAHAAPQPQIAVVDDPPKLAQRVIETPKVVEIVQPAAQPPPLPGPWKPLPSALPAVAHEAADPRLRVAQANLAARVQPSRAGYVNAVQVYPFAEGALYQLYAAPGEITTSRSRSARRWRARDRSRRATRCAGSSATPRAARAPQGASTSWSSPAPPTSRPIS